MDNSFFSTARLTYLAYVDGAGNVLSTPVVGMGNSGYSYDASGAHAAETAAVPEPTTWAMMVGGFGLVGGAVRRRRKNKTAVQLA